MVLEPRFQNSTFALSSVASSLHSQRDVGRGSGSGGFNFIQTCLATVPVWNASDEGENTGSYSINARWRIAVTRRNQPVTARGAAPARSGAAATQIATPTTPLTDLQIMRVLWV